VTPAEVKAGVPTVMAMKSSHKTQYTF